MKKKPQKKNLRRKSDAETLKSNRNNKCKREKQIKTDGKATTKKLGQLLIIP